MSQPIYVTVTSCGTRPWQLVNWNVTPPAFSWSVCQTSTLSSFSIEVTLDNPMVSPLSANPQGGMLGNPPSAAPFVFNPYAYNGPYGSSATSAKATAITSAGWAPCSCLVCPIAAWRINMNTWGASSPTVVTFMQQGLKQ
jgi:hypothetical protein